MSPVTLSHLLQNRIRYTLEIGGMKNIKKLSFPSFKTRQFSHQLLPSICIFGDNWGNFLSQQVDCLFAACRAVDSRCLGGAEETEV